MSQTRHPVPEREPVSFHPGDHILISEGDYSDYQVISILRVKVECTDLGLTRAWFTCCEPRLRYGTGFAAFLTYKEYAEDVGFWEINVSDAKEEG